MDYTKVLSALNRVKDALEKKIDAVNTSVSGLPDTLDTQFTAVKNEIATVKTDVGGVKTDVAGVGSKVDAGVTTLGNKIDETNVLIKNATDVKTFYTKENSRIVTFKGNIEKNQEVSLVDIVGKGKIIGFKVDADREKLEKVTINIDGKEIKLQAYAPNGSSNFTTQTFEFCSYDSCNRVDGKARSVLVFNDAFSGQERVSFPTTEIYSDSGRVIRFEDFIKLDNIATDTSNDGSYKSSRGGYRSASSIIYPCISFEHNFSIKMKTNPDYVYSQEAIVVYQLNE